MSTKSDADHFLKMIESSFVEKPLIRRKRERHSKKLFSTPTIPKDNCKNGFKSFLFQNIGVLDAVYVYPIKSCDGCLMTKGYLSRKGLKYDGEWVIVDSKGSAITSSKCPRLSVIKPQLNHEKGILELNCEGKETSLAKETFIYSS